VWLVAPRLAMISVTYGLARFAYGLFVPQMREVFALSSSVLRLGRVLRETALVLSHGSKANAGATQMVRRGELTDRAWQELEPLLPEYNRSGGQDPSCL